MTRLQTRILWAVAVFSIVFNMCCFSFCMWSDYQLEKVGISIETILAEGGR